MNELAKELEPCLSVMGDGETLVIGVYEFFRAGDTWVVGGEVFTSPKDAAIKIMDQ